MIYIRNRLTARRHQFNNAEYAIAFMHGKDFRDYAMIREQLLPWPRPGDPDALKAMIRKAFQ